MTRLITALLVALLPIAAMAENAGAEMRTVTGQIIIPERLSMPENAVVLIDVSDTEDNPVAATRRRTEGQQSPLDFDISVPEDTILVARVGVRGLEDVVWLSEPIGIEADAGDLDLGAIRALRIPMMGATTVLRCGTQIIELGFTPDEIRLRLNEQIIAMQPQPAASGAYYVAANNPSTSVHMKGDRAILRIDGAELSECEMIRAASNLGEGLWTITAIRQTPTLFPSRTELVFYPDGRISASVGCNRLIGSYRRHGGILTFGRIASTLMACPEALSAQERAFAEALREIDGYHIDPETGRLHLSASGETMLRARR